jgi:CRISPR-associated endonuclease/helicase Cas3
VNFEHYFERLASTNDVRSPHDWQRDLAVEQVCADRLIRVPTGFGKTLGVLAAWLWHRVERADENWPRRLVWCLPMRVLVEQTEAEVRAALSRLDRLWDGRDVHSGKVGVHLLMGGAETGDWHLWPEHCAVLIGTQDMLLSRALNRGYGAARGRWPMDFGLLNQDCLWIMDEVQLMDVGLATSGQLQSFRLEDQDFGRSVRPCHTWWMSATLQRAWLESSPDTRPMAVELPQSAIPLENRRGHLWDDVSKPVKIETTADAKAVAGLVSHAHVEGAQFNSGPTLVVLNRVEDAVAVWQSLANDENLASTDLRLVHSRFRPHERVAWREAFLNRDAYTLGVDRIIVSTQVIEAGVDVSASVLVTQLAPWPSLVQRFGRAARWGGEAQVIVVDFQPNDDKAAAPYTKNTLDAARDALSYLEDVAPASLESFEEDHPELLPALYPYAPKHLLLRNELEDLFDTTADLSGVDVDISRFIRSGEERDLQVFWQEVPRGTMPDRKVKPSRDALCAVRFLDARVWLCGKETASKKAPRLKAGMRAWVWDYLDGGWRQAERRDLYPGQTVLVDAESGGYDTAVGWNPKIRTRVELVAPAVPTPEDEADAAENDESLSAFPWQTIAVHGEAVGREAAAIAGLLDSNRQRLFDLAGRWHDAGKAHRAFQNSIAGANRPRRQDLAKAPKEAWLSPMALYPDAANGRRRGFRHELASTLALLAVLIRHQPDHPALLGPWRRVLEAAGVKPTIGSGPDVPPNALEKEILALGADDFDLLAYLVCAHHGKVRVAWHASLGDQQSADSVLRIRGIRHGEKLPSVLLATAEREFTELPVSTLLLDAASVGLNPVTGRGWTERVLGLLRRHGPFTLTYLEALLRAADQRASRQPVQDLLLSEQCTEEKAA